MTAEEAAPQSWRRVVHLFQAGQHIGGRGGYSSPKEKKNDAHVAEHSKMVAPRIRGERSHRQCRVISNDASSLPAMGSRG